jgi:hypothetical protein
MKVTVRTQLVEVPAFGPIGPRAAMTTKKPSPVRTMSRQISSRLEKGQKPSGGKQPTPQRRSLTLDEAAWYAKMNSNRKGRGGPRWTPATVTGNPALVGPFEVFKQPGRHQKLSYEATRTSETIKVSLRPSLNEIVQGMAARGYEVIGRRPADVRAVAKAWTAAQARKRKAQARKAAREATVNTRSV